MVQKPAAIEIQDVVGKFATSMSSKCMPMPYLVPSVSKAEDTRMGTCKLRPPAGG
jgi:hypothetical protein